MGSFPHLHRLAEARSLAIHAKVAEALRENPDLIQAARRRVEGWLVSGAVHPAYATQWQRLLEGPLDVLLFALADPGEQARALRQCSPFAGVVDPRTRWRLWREVSRTGPLA
jgi:hypothetical protein